MAVSKVISIEITDLNTKLIEVSYNKKTPTIYKTVSYNNPEGTVEDAFIVDKGRYTSELRAQLKNAGIKCKDVVFVISSNKILSREVTIPDMKEKLIDEYIEGEKATYFPMDISDHRLSYTIINRDSASKQLKLLVYAAPETLISNYNSIAAELDFNIVAMDSSGNAIYKFLERNASSGIDFYLQINESNTLLTILDNGKFALQRNMNFGTQSLVEHLVDEEYYGILTPDQAGIKLTEDELLYTSYSEMMEFMPTDEESSKLHECKKRLTDAVRPLIAGFTRALEYYNTKNKEAVINKVYIGGRGSKIKLLDKLIMSEFESIEIETLNVLPNLKYNRKDILMANSSTEYIACVGASTYSIDFSKEMEEKDKKGATIFALFAGVLTLVAVAILVGIPLLNYKLALDKQEKLREDIASLQYIADMRSQLTTRNNNLEELKSFDESTITKNEDWNHILEQFEIMLPTNTIVSSVSSNETGVTLIVTIPSKKEAAKLLVQLRNIPIFEDVQINSLSETDDQATGIKNESFTITCLFPQPVEEAPPADAEADTQAAEDIVAE